MPDSRWTAEDAEDAYAEGDLERALEVCEALLEANPEEPDALYLMGEVMLELEEFEAAEEIFRDALGLEPESGALYNGLGVALFELCRFDEARKALETALDLDPRLAESRMYLGFFHERRGEFDRAQEQFQHAVSLDSEHFQLPTEISLEQLQAAIEDVIDRLPDALRGYLSGVPWSVEDVPPTATLRSRVPPLSPLLSCLIPGTPRDPVQTPMPLEHAPVEIVLFRRNLARSLQTAGELPTALLHALLFELEGYLELDDAEVEALGIRALLEEAAASTTLEDGPAGRVLH